MYRPLPNLPNKPLYDITFACSFLCSQQMAACEQIRAHAVKVNCFSDLGLRRFYVVLFSIAVK